MSIDRLKLFFTYYGGKWRVAQHYPKPLYNTIIEPFAGSAGYALHYYWHDVFLYDLNPVICQLWEYLIKVKKEEIMALPLTCPHVDKLDVCQEARYLIGFWLNKGCSSPHKQPTTWMKRGDCPNSFWGETIRQRIANQVDKIRHWKIKCKSYADIPNERASWFIDPPYHKSGTAYKYKDINYSNLAAYCKERKGQVIVCEQEGADWLPFENFRTIRTLDGKYGKKKSNEVVWYQDDSCLGLEVA